MKQFFARLYSRFFWIVPFLFFLLGYLALGRFVRQDECTVPVLIGLPVQEALLRLSEVQLGARVLTQKDDADVAPGTVLQHIPRPGQTIKTNQPVFLVIAKQPAKYRVPDLVYKKSDEAVAVLSKSSVRAKLLSVASPSDPGVVVGQWPLAGSDLDAPFVLLYLSSGRGDGAVVFPDLKGQSLTAVRTFLHEHCGSYVTLDVVPLSSRVHKNSEEQCCVVSQKPLAGSLVYPQKTVYVQLGVDLD